MPHIYYLFQYIYLFTFLLLQRFRKPNYFKRKASSLDTTLNVYKFRPHNKKPEWIKQKILYLKALLPNCGCRKIATTFNRLHDSENVSKSYVCAQILNQRPEIIKLRRKLKHKIPKQVPKNLIWSMDLTMIDKQQVSTEETSASQTTSVCFGIIDNGTRGLILLELMKDKSTITLLKALLETIEKFGKPKALRSDNEIVFTSKIMKFALWLLGIKQQTTEMASPWQNGRIERLFGTLKVSIKDLVFPSEEALKEALKEFRFFYNHVRPHQHLYGKTPSEAWTGSEMVTKKSAKKVYYFNGLAGNVGGFYFLKKHRSTTASACFME